MPEPKVVFCTRPVNMPNTGNIDRWQAMSDNSVRLVDPNGIVTKIGFMDPHLLIKDVSNGRDVYCEDKNWVPPPTVVKCVRAKCYPDQYGDWRPGRVDRIRIYSNNTTKIVNTDGSETSPNSWTYEFTIKSIRDGHWEECSDKKWEAPQVFPTPNQWFENWERTMFNVELGKFNQDLKTSQGHMVFREYKYDIHGQYTAISMASPTGEVRHYSRMSGKWRRVDTLLTTEEMFKEWEKKIFAVVSTHRFNRSDFPETKCIDGYVNSNVWSDMPSIRIYRYDINSTGMANEYRDYSACFYGWGKICK